MAMAKSVLIVEDELFVAKDIQDMLEAAGFETIGPCDTVTEALATIEVTLPDCAVLDVKLRDGEVFAVADRLDALGVPIIFHSGHADGRALTERYEGARFFSKPCAPSVLERAVIQAATTFRLVEQPLVQVSEA